VRGAGAEHPWRRLGRTRLNLAGVVCAGSTGHDFPKQKHWEREGVKASLSRGKMWPEEWPAQRSVMAPWPVPPELTGKTLGTTFSHGRKPERERERRRAHHGEN